MKLRYIGRTTLPMSINIPNLPYLENGKYYEVIKQNDNYYMIIDGKGRYKLIKKSEFERGGSM